MMKILELHFDYIFYQFIFIHSFQLCSDTFYMNSNMNNYSEPSMPNSVYSVPSAVIVSTHTFSSNTSINRFFPSICIPTCPLQDSSFSCV